MHDPVRSREDGPEDVVDEPEGAGADARRR